MTQKMPRLFLALWPDETVREQLAALAKQLVSQPVPSANLHMTLVFPGASSPDQQACIIDAAAQLSGEPLSLQLDYLGGFPRPAIQWLGCQHIPNALQALADACQGLLPTCGYVPETRRFVPHVTLSRKVRQPCFRVIETPIHWQVDDFALLESCPEKGGVRYRVIEKWGLGNAGSCV